MNDTLAGASPVDQPVRPRRADVVPGVMHCARCKFRLQRVNLYVNVGAVGAGDNDTEPCPNGCGPLWPVTWEQEAREGYKLAEDLFDRAKRAEDVLRDLVALEDMRLRLRSLHERGHGTDYEHYHEGLPKAWDAARAVLLGPNVRANRPSGAATGVAMTDKVAGPDGSVLSEGLGPNVPERGECDAPICPWCERQGWDNCSHADYAKTCEVRQYDI